MLRYVKLHRMIRQCSSLYNVTHRSIRTVYRLRQNSQETTLNHPSVAAICLLGCLSGYLVHAQANTRDAPSQITGENVINSIYQSEELKCGLASGANLPDEEEDAIDESGGSSVYGEVTYRGVEKLIYSIGGVKGKVFYDLGSGLGKMCLQVAMNFNAQKAVGVELSTTRHNAACSALQYAIDQHLLAATTTVVSFLSLCPSSDS